MTLVVDSTTGVVTQVPYRNISQLHVWSPGLKTKIVVLSVLAAVIVFLLVVVKEVYESSKGREQRRETVHV